MTVENEKQWPRSSQRKLTTKKYLYTLRSFESEKKGKDTAWHKDTIKGIVFENQNKKQCGFYVPTPTVFLLINKKQKKSDEERIKILRNTAHTTPSPSPSPSPPPPTKNNNKF